MDLKKPGSHYHMDKKKLLPKFGSASNPLTTAEKVQLARPEPEVKIEPARGRAFTPQEIVAAQSKADEAAPGIGSDFKPEQKPAARKPSFPSGIGALARRVAANVNPLGWWKRRQAQRQLSFARAKNAPVQGELSLDRIKVVRNDLSDADVEIVPAKVKTPTSRTAPALETAAAAPAPEMQRELVKT